MIPPNLKAAILQAPNTTKTRLILTWDICQKTFSEKKSLLKKSPLKNYEENDLNFVIENLKKSKYYDPDMKNCLSYLKITGLIFLVLTISLITTLVCLVIPGDLKLETFFIFGVSSSFMIILVLMVLGWFFLIADEDTMVNREMEFKKIIEEINLRHFIGKGMLWKCGRFGGYLSLENINLGKGDFDEEERRLPTFEDVYEDGKCYYFVQGTKKPFCGPVSAYDPLKRVKKGLYFYVKRWKEMEKER